MTGAPLRALGKVHGTVIHSRRLAALAPRLAGFIPPNTHLLDIGCGDGVLGALLREAVPGLEIQGVEVGPRQNCAIECRPFDGTNIPFPDSSFDGCLLVDVLHHITDPSPLIREACRVSREFLLIKDHLAETRVDHWTLRLMDWVGNRPHGVPLPYAYLSESQWNELYRKNHLAVVNTQREIPLYPPPFSFVFGRNLHFVSFLRKSE